MIKINLLPEELRPKEAATLPYASVVLGGGGCAIVLACALILYYVFKITSLEADAAETRVELAKVKRDLSDAERRKEEHKTELERKKIALEIKGKRALWSAPLDALWTVMDDMGDVWVEGITLAEEKQKKLATKKAGQRDPDITLQVRMGSSSSQPDLYAQWSEKRMAELLERMLAQPVFARGRYNYGVSIWKSTDTYRERFGIPAMSYVIGVGQWRGP